VTPASFEEAFFAAVRQLQGSYALICRFHSGRRENYSPRAKTARWCLRSRQRRQLIGSDVLSFLPYSAKLCMSKTAMCRHDKKYISDIDLNHTPKAESVAITWELSEAGKGEYDPLYDQRNQKSSRS